MDVTTFAFSFLAVVWGAIPASLAIAARRRRAAQAKAFAEA